jgi:hypothetical protein
MIKSKLIIGLFLLTSFVQAQTTDIPLISIDVKDMAFEQFAELVEQKTHLQIIFKTTWVTDLKVSVNAQQQNVVTLVKSVLPAEEFNVVQWNDFIVILKDDHLIEDLPEYDKISVVNEGADEKSNAETDFIKGRKADLMKIKVGKSNYQNTGEKVQINGIVVDAITGEPVENATLYIIVLKKGAITNQQGDLEMVLPPGKYAAEFECLGMKTVNCQLEVMSEGSFKLKMEMQKFDIREVAIYGDRQMSFREKDPGLEKLNVKTIKELPTMMGESDIIRVSEMLPGVVSVGEGSAGLNVRGGGFDQNAFYFNKVAIYNTSHMFGFYPAFNTDIINDFSLYKGYIPARYGGRLSSIFNINARTGNKKKYTLHGGISPIAANITLEGPIKRDTASFFVNVRSSYSDWVLKRIDDYNIRNSEASFYDVTFSFDYDLPRTQFNIFGYRSQDYFKFSDINTYWYSNTGLSGTAGHSFSSKFRSDFSISASLYEYKTIDEQLESAAYEHEFKLAQYDFSADFSYAFNSNNILNFGANSVWYQLNQGQVLPFGDNSNRKPLDLGKEKGLETSFYISENFDPLPLLNIRAGFRFSFYSAFGPDTVYTYFDNGPKDERTINDTIFFGNGPIKWYTFPEFRISLNYQTDENGSIKLAFNQMHQSIFMLNNTISISPNRPWKLSDYHLRPGRSYQFSAGVFRTSFRKDWEFSLEGFYKNAKDYTEFKDGVNFLGSSLVETTVLQGDLNSYGVEVLLKKYWPKINIWFAYTFSRSFVQVDGLHKWDQINDGVKYPSNFDIPHVVNAVFNYHISKRIVFSTTITYQTGRPATFPTSFYYIDGVPHLDYSNRNEYRIPDYFRTDISLTVEGNLKKKKLLHSTFHFSVYNLTSRENPYSVYFEEGLYGIQGIQYSVIGVPIFMITWIFKLGNYDAD